MAKINLKKTSRDFLDPFSTNVPLLYPLKTSVNQRFSDVFRSWDIGIKWVKVQVNYRV